LKRLKVVGAVADGVAFFVSTPKKFSNRDCACAAPDRVSSVAAINRRNITVRSGRITKLEIAAKVRRWRRGARLHAHAAAQHAAKVAKKP